jgi:hypothetical protein
MTAQPLLPNVTAEQYEAERDPLRQVNSMERIVQIGPYKFRATATDWPDVKSAETAASRLAVILNTEHRIFTGRAVNDILDDLGERIRAELNIDDSRPYGMTFVAEPL